MSRSLEFTVPPVQPSRWPQDSVRNPVLSQKPKEENDSERHPILTSDVQIHTNWHTHVHVHEYTHAHTRTHLQLLYILTPPQFICPGPAGDNKYLSTGLSMLTLASWCQAYISKL